MSIMNVLDDTLYVHVLGDGKDVYESVVAGSELLRLYVQILVVLIDGKHCSWSKGSTVRGAIGLLDVTSAGVTGWKLPRTARRRITIDG